MDLGEVGEKREEGAMEDQGVVVAVVDQEIQRVTFRRGLLDRQAVPVIQVRA